MKGGRFSPYFSEEAGWGEVTVYAVVTIYVVSYTLLSVLAPLITPSCDEQPADHMLRARSDVEYRNVDYPKDACKFTRYAALGYMTKWEADMCARIFYSLLVGSLIGFERRRADRPAGIRTMAMVCMGACVFTIGSNYGFWDGPMSWDSARVSAAVPSGVGFLGAASIWKGKQAGEVHGLTTATSVWLSAAIGILVGGHMYGCGVFSTLVGVVYLRFAPR